VRLFVGRKSKNPYPNPRGLKLYNFCDNHAVNRIPNTGVDPQVGRRLVWMAVNAGGIGL
jgi:hypothetical protein